MIFVPKMYVFIQNTRDGEGPKESPQHCTRGAETPRKPPETPRKPFEITAETPRKPLTYADEKPPERLPERPPHTRDPFFEVPVRQRLASSHGFGK